jgi:2-oxoglutarate ferredoxin oxidoreductase subunit delta
MLKRMPMSPAPPPVRGRVFIRKSRCKGCQYCIEFCPQGVLVLSRDYNAKGYRYPVVVKDVCINCTLCLTLCPDYAILSKRMPPAAKPAVGATAAPATSETRRMG